MNLSILLHTLIDKIEKLTEALLLICKLLSLLTAASRNKKTEISSLSERKLWTQREVMEYLSISLSTYKRRVKEGLLKPITLTGDDRYFEEDLTEAMERSRMKGKV
ncbi:MULTISPECIES: hypothetical protein [Sphingobacterium]|jgi:hypothetical protein|uniref:hypothetical protein n=1 Tax=Sphingobacterium TaxID=28453 RepID=UPI00038A1F2E|nr:hypothetical protein [Sphingobacterium sp. IITKGP-BTPF85]KKX46610.1 hypothetical protein L950_0230970 [Sphingobacterium sp. IITKGP-BTPF85]